MTIFKRILSSLEAAGVSRRWSIAVMVVTVIMIPTPVPMEIVPLVVVAWKKWSAILKSKKQRDKKKAKRKLKVKSKLLSIRKNRDDGIRVIKKRSKAAARNMAANTMAMLLNKV